MQPVFLQCRDAQAALSEAQQLILHMSGLSAQKTKEFCDLLKKAGQGFNIASKQVSEDWADQKLQANELKKTISNWTHDDGRPDRERDEELWLAHSNAFDLRCQLHTHKERLENIKFETQCLIRDCEKLRKFKENDQAYLRGVDALYKVRRSSTDHIPSFLAAHAKGFQPVKFILMSPQSSSLQLRSSRRLRC